MDMLAAMKMFVSVIEHGSMSAAARAMSVGQPTVSDRVAALERKLGVRLIDRSNRKSLPTAIGRKFYETSKTTIEAVDHAASVVAISRGLMRGTLRISAPEILCDHILPRIIQGFWQQKPALVIELVHDDRSMHLDTEAIDVMLQVGARPEGHRAPESLGALEQILVASPEYLGKNGTPKTAAELEAHCFLKLKGTMTGNLLSLCRGSVTLPVPVSPYWTVNRISVLGRLVCKGAGIGVLPSLMCTKALASGALVQLFGQYTLSPLPVWLSYSRRATTNPLIQAMISHLRSELSHSLSASSHMPDLELLPDFELQGGEDR